MANSQQCSSTSFLGNLGWHPLFKVSGSGPAWLHYILPDYTYLQYGGCRWRRRKCVPFRSTWCHSRFFFLVGVHISSAGVFLCDVLFPLSIAFLMWNIFFGSLNCVCEQSLFQVFTFRPCFGIFFFYILVSYHGCRFVLFIADIWLSFRSLVKSMRSLALLTIFWLFTISNYFISYDICTLNKLFFPWFLI